MNTINKSILFSIFFSMIFCSEKYYRKIGYDSNYSIFGRYELSDSQLENTRFYKFIYNTSDELESIEYLYNGESIEGFPDLNELSFAKVEFHYDGNYEKRTYHDKMGKPMPIDKVFSHRFKKKDNKNVAVFNYDKKNNLTKDINGIIHYFWKVEKTSSNQETDTEYSITNIDHLKYNSDNDQVILVDNEIEYHKKRIVLDSLKNIIAKYYYTDLMKKELVGALYKYEYDDIGNLIKIKEIKQSKQIEGTEAGSSKETISQSEQIEGTEAGSPNEIISKIFYNEKGERIIDRDNAYKEEILFYYNNDLLDVETKLANGTNDNYIYKEIIIDWDGPCLKSRMEIDRNGQLIKGYIEQECDQFGNIIKRTFIGKYHQLVQDKQNGYAIIKWVYNDDGKSKNKIKETYYGIDEQVMIVEQFGYSSISWEYDSDGNKIKESYFDKDEKLVIPEQLGYSSISWEYDSDGNKIKENYLDKDGKLVISEKLGCSSISWEYDDNRNKIEEAYFDKDEMLLAPQKIGYASIEWRYDNNNNKIEESYFDIDGQSAIPERLGYSTVKWGYNKQDQIVSESYFQYNESGEIIKLDEGGCVLDCISNECLTDPENIELWGKCYNIAQTDSLDLSYSRLEGVIPLQLTKLNNLTYLSLSNNNLIGSLPDQIGSLYKLIYLDVSSNQLTGPIPKSIKNLSNLTKLSLNDNHLSGYIPEEICDLNLMWQSFLDISTKSNISNNKLCPKNDLYPKCKNIVPKTDINKRRLKHLKLKEENVYIENVFITTQANQDCKDE